MLDEMPSVDVFSEKITETSKLICYTDGLSELPDDDGNESGTKAMEECIRNTKRVDVNIQELISSQKIVEGNSRIFDDVSILGIQFYV